MWGFEIQQRVPWCAAFFPKRMNGLNTVPFDYRPAIKGINKTRVQKREFYNKGQRRIRVTHLNLVFV